jgi:hypothetical protein
LKPGDIVAAISLSSGLASLIPHRSQAAKHQIEERFGVKVIETPYALRDGDWLYRNPKARELPKSLKFEQVGSAAVCEALDGLLGPENWDRTPLRGSLLVTFPESLER